MESRPIVKHKSVVESIHDGWEVAVLNNVMHLLKYEETGQVCIGTETGKDCWVYVVFRNGGSA